MTDKYYIIKQSFPYLPTKINKVYCPCNMKHLKELLSFFTGTIEVYLYDEKSGKREDLTNQLGNRDFDIYSQRIDKFSEVKQTFVAIATKDQYYNFYSNNDEVYNFRQIFMLNEVFKLKSTMVFSSISSLLSCDIEEHKQKQRYGNDYENYIANKYLQYGYEVENRGIKKAFNDGGIDIIAKRDNNLVLVQCKNWKMSNSYKINQKDLRAFIGDCFLYLKNINLDGVKVSYHFIVSHDNILTKSANIFLEENSFIKFKCVPYE